MGSYHFPVKFRVKFWSINSFLHTSPSSSHLHSVHAVAKILWLTAFLRNIRGVWIGTNLYCSGVGSTIWKVWNWSLPVLCRGRVFVMTGTVNLEKQGYWERFTMWLYLYMAVLTIMRICSQNNSWEDFIYILYITSYLSVYHQVTTSTEKDFWLFHTWEGG